MTYIELLNSFWDSTKLFPFTSNEAAMYIYLLHQCDIRGWMNPFEFSTRDLELTLGITRATISAIRNKLKQRGLIDFGKGVGSGKSVYLICGAKVTNEALSDKICVHSLNTNGDCVYSLNTKLNTNGNCVHSLNTNGDCVYSLNTKLNTNPICVHSLNTKSNTNPGDTIYIDNNITNISANADSARARVRARARGKPKEKDSLFSKAEMKRTEMKGVKAADLVGFSPPTPEQVRDFFINQNAPAKIAEWETEVMSFYSYYDSQGWVKGNGRKVANWESLAIAWIIRREKEQKQSKQNEQTTSYRRNTSEDTLADEQAKLARRIIARRNGCSRSGPDGNSGVP